MAGPSQQYIYGNVNRNFQLFPYCDIKMYIVSAQKNRLNETVLLSTHNIYFAWEIRKLLRKYYLLSGALHSYTWITTDKACLNADYFNYFYSLLLNNDTHWYSLHLE